ncbi:uncharacterized protein LOC128555871 [Mercenaria mercenaria]|uniref:uncharacterized protein LOC128555871 n=1 Tax=Mercenaria mercenaria TaxID=6596 RepID=UPI00234F14DA|nr:uncharacterized protein LOC128555871 [Mercenaria mercenaria]
MEVVHGALDQGTIPRSLLINMRFPGFNQYWYCVTSATIPPLPATMDDGSPHPQCTEISPYGLNRLSSSIDGHCYHNYCSYSKNDTSSSGEDDEEELKKHRLSLTKKKQILASRKERREDLEEKRKQAMQDQHDEKRHDLASNYFNITPRMERKSRKFKTQSKVYEVTFKPYDQPYDFTYELFNAMVDKMKEECQTKPGDKVRVSIDHPGLKLGIHVPFDNASAVTGETVLQEIENVMQSNEDFNIHDGQLHAEITPIPMPEGSGKARRNMHHGSHVTIENMTQLKRSVMQVDNPNDSICLARSIEVGICHAQKSNTEEWKKRWNMIRQSKKSLQQKEAQTLLDSVGIGYDQPCGIEEYQKIQTKLYPDYIIKVHTQNVKGEPLFTPPTMRKGSKVIHVYYHGGHYDTITSIKGFYGHSYYCEYCDIGYNNLEQHKCKNICQCYSTESGVQVVCSDCRITFKSVECYHKHKQITGHKKKSICESIWQCQSCHGIVVGTKKSHVCSGSKKCRYCKDIVGPNHECHIPNYVSPESEGHSDYIFFYFESRFDTSGHIFNFCCAQRFCDECIHKDIIELCDHCDRLPEPRDMLFRGDNTGAEFCTWLFKPTHKGSTVIAHNVQGYDGQFTLRYIVSHTTIKPEVIMNGSKLISLKCHGLRKIDSLSFLSMPLSAFPKTSGLTEMVKGYFPHWAKKAEYQNYVGHYLDSEYYHPGGMKPEAREVFLEWHQEKVNTQSIFDFQKEKYCRSDVDLLRRGCSEFQHQLMASDDINPFTECVTLAQVCYCAHKNTLPEKSLGIISDAGYPNKTRYSIKGVRWLQAEATIRGKPIRHALNGGEVRIGPYSVDGYNAETNTMYEFLGCWTHVCETCYPKREVKNPYSLKTMNTLYVETFSRFEC